MFVCCNFELKLQNQPKNVPAPHPPYQLTSSELSARAHSTHARYSKKDFWHEVGLKKLTSRFFFF